MPNGPAAAVGLAVGAKGGVHAPVSACASGAEAIRWGLDLLRSDRADVVLVGGTEACVHPLPMAGFAAMRAMSTRNDEPERASRPFDKARDGFVLGEGAGRTRPRAASTPRPAAPGSTPGSPVPAPPPTATTWSRRTPRARAPAARSPPRCGTPGCPPADIGHVNAHATSTPVGDIAEAAAIRNAIGEHVLVSATKARPVTCSVPPARSSRSSPILALREQIVPGDRQPRRPGRRRRVQALDIVRDEPRRATLSAAVNDSFGFGGHNVALVFTTA